MRDLILQQLSPDRRREDNLNRMRETLQIVLLKILHDSRAGSALAFTGGTALRLLHQLPRFSEDLDFSLVKAEKYDIQELARTIEKNLARLALPAELRIKAVKNVHHIVVRFTELLYQAGLSPQKDQKLPIRLEIDTNPPAGWATQISLLSRIYTFPLLHFDLPSMLATKLHACLYRRYAKGRDFYDLMWYLGRRVQPNLVVLHNAIAQTEKKVPALSSDSLQEMLLNKISTLDADALRQDVAPFLERPEEANLLDVGLMRQVISGYDFSGPMSP